MMEDLPVLREFARFALAELSTVLEERTLGEQDDDVLIMFQDVFTVREWSGACEVRGGGILYG